MVVFYLCLAVAVFREAIFFITNQLTNYVSGSKLGEGSTQRPYGGPSVHFEDADRENDTVDDERIGNFTTLFVLF